MEFFFFFKKICQEIISLSIVLCLFIHDVKHWLKTRSSDYATHIYTRITSARDFGEFLGTVRYAATEFYLMIILVI